MRYRNAASHCAPVCYVQSAANEYAKNNRVRKSFTYVRAASSLEQDMEEIKETVEELRKLLSAGGERDRILDALYTLKADAFDIEAKVSIKRPSSDAGERCSAFDG